MLQWASVAASSGSALDPRVFIAGVIRVAEWSLAQWTNALFSISNVHQVGVKQVGSMVYSHRRRTEGDETWCRLQGWTRGQKAAERLASHVLRSEGFQSIEPSHPLGGKDGLKDMICIKDSARWIGAVYFPRGQQPFKDIKKKFNADRAGVAKNNVDGIVFITNQELSLSQRRELMSVDHGQKTEIFHLERLAAVLDNPSNYGVRLEFLDIAMTSEEQLAYFAERDKRFLDLVERMEQFVQGQRDLPFEGRSEANILAAIDEFFDKIWYDRHQGLKIRVEKGKQTVSADVWQGALKAAKRVEKKYGVKNLGPWTDFEWGMLNGKLSALRWVLGDEWDLLDT